MADSNTISFEAIQSLSKQLRAFKRGWVQDLAPKMKLSDDESDDTAKSRIYNICNEVVTSPDMRILFIEKGSQLLEEFKTKNKKIIDKAQQLEKHL